MSIEEPKGPVFSEEKKIYAHIAEGGPLIPNLTMIEKIQRNWGLFLTLGILLILIGFIAIGAATATSLVTVFFLGFLLLIGGITKLIYSFWVRKWSGFFLSLFLGVLYAVAGLLFLSKPVPVLATLTLIFGLLFIVSGVFKISVSLTYRFEQWGWLLFSGIVSLLLGLFVVMEWPEASLWIIGLFVGIDLIFYGWTWVILSLAAKQAPKH